MDNYSEDFITALEQHDLQSIKAIPKSDLHNHAMLGSRFEKLVGWHKKPLPAPPLKFSGMPGMDAYLSDVLRKVILTKAGFDYALNAAFEQAIEDGVTVLEMSIDIWLARLFSGSAKIITQRIAEISNNFSGRVLFIPQLGFARERNIGTVSGEVMDFVETGFYRSIDVYGHELSRSPKTFKELFKEARNANIRLKAHAGEFGDAESVRTAVDELDLDEVQHGIAAAGSMEVMRWLHERGTQLNVCASSNVALGIVPDLRSHPLRILVDNGVNVTINTDDLMLFGQSASDEYLNLFRAGVLNAKELDEIRQAGLDESMNYLRV
jgi:adenosine deaminase